ncbi:helix-turn-helix domain-containing protein [Paenibacillus sp. GCM10028914]|uniref:helix-turn-helix domain-containing protein n=1 Tax=Paenibacillus sp. GCM10028914 TaxID=3273416 RepID=UPI0036131002
MKWIQSQKRTLYFKIFVSFLSLILLFGCFYVLIYKMYRSGLEQEMVRSSQTQTENTAERFAQYFERIQILLFDLYHDPDLISFNSELNRYGPDGANYLKAKEVIENIRKEAYNPLFMVQDVIVHFEETDLAFGKSGSSSHEYMFEHFYHNMNYSLPFWKEQLDDEDAFSILQVRSFQLAARDLESKQLMPYIFKYPDTSYQLVAMIDIEQAANAFFGTAEQGNLVLMDKRGNILYSMDEDFTSDQIPLFSNNQSMVKQDGAYFFKTIGSNGLTYITSAPDTQITVQLQQLSKALLFVFVLSLAAAIIAAIILSRRLHSPVKQMLSSLLDRTSVGINETMRSDKHDARGQIWEYELIQKQINQLQKEKESIVERLKDQNAALQSYTYMNQLKNINTDINEWSDFLNSTGRYHIVYYDIRFRNAGTHVQEDKNRVIRHLLEHIHLISSESVKDTHTFQMERDEIISVLKGASSQDLGLLLDRIKKTFDTDHEHYLVNVCVSPLVADAFGFNEAYHRLRTLSSQGYLAEETQILFEERELPDIPAIPSAPLNHALQSGNEERCMDLVEELMVQFYEQGAGIQQFREFVDLIAIRFMETAKELLPGEDGYPALRLWMDGIQDCHTLAEYRQGFYPFVSAACTLVRKRQSSVQEPIITMFFEIIQHKYMEDLSLDYLSDKLNLSSAYLSAYIKEKTGMNFSDHLQGIRMSKACELLITTGMNVNEISQLVGYQNITSFNRSFKKVTHMTPGAYRKQHVIQEYRISM